MDDVLGRVRLRWSILGPIDTDRNRTDHAGQKSRVGEGIAQTSFRSRLPGTERPDAVMYCLGALERFEPMPLQEVQKIGLEIAVLGTRGIDPNDADKRYTLKTLPGEYSGLQLLCLMFVAFKAVAPDRDIGFDVSREYQTAVAMHTARKGKSES